MDPVTSALALLFTAIAAAVVPVYLVRYGPWNFLWFSDIALLGMLAALWRESSLIASMMALAVLLPEMLWAASFLGGLVFGRSVSTLTAYMFDAATPRYLRALSLFHLALPPALIWMLGRYGYDPRALPAQTLLTWLVLPATLAWTPPEKNVNWVHGFGHPARTPLAPRAHFWAMMAAYPLLLYVPTHFVLVALFGMASNGR